MLKIVFLLLILSSPALAAEEKLTCDIEVEFNSDTSGIDANTYTKIMERIVATPTITEKHVENVGASGERTLCLRVQPDKLDIVYKDLRTLVPEESQETWTRISSRDGQEFKTRPPSIFTRRHDWR